MRYVISLLSGEARCVKIWARMRLGEKMIFRIVMKEDRDARNENEFW